MQLAMMEAATRDSIFVADRDAFACVKVKGDAEIPQILQVSRDERQVPGKGGGDQADICLNRIGTIRSRGS
jgi:hypothetical protein